MVENKKKTRAAFNYHSDDEDSVIGGLRSDKKGVCNKIIVINCLADFWLHFKKDL